jgi:hypothetical protein
VISGRQTRPSRTPYHVFHSLPIPQKESRIERHVPAHFQYYKESYPVQNSVALLKRLTHICFQSFHHRFVAWTKPSNTSLILGTVTDLARSKSELVGENALLRQQLIILRRQVKRPTCAKTDRLILVLLARASRAWKQAQITCPTRDAPALAPPGFSPILEVQVQSSILQTKDTRRNRCFDQGNGGAESALGS